MPIRSGGPERVLDCPERRSQRLSVHVSRSRHLLADGAMSRPWLPDHQRLVALACRIRHRSFRRLSALCPVPRPSTPETEIFPPPACLPRATLQRVLNPIRFGWSRLRCRFRAHIIHRFYVTFQDRSQAPAPIPDLQSRYRVLQGGTKSHRRRDTSLPRRYEALSLRATGNKHRTF